MMGLVNTASPLVREPRRTRFRIAVAVSSLVAATVGAVLLATRDSGQKVTTRGVTATLRVPGHPGWVAAGSDALWFALADAGPPIRDRPLLRLDLASGAIQRRILMGGETSYLMHVGDRLLASVEHVGGEGTGPSLIVALDWRSGRVLMRRQFPGLLGPLAAHSDGLDLWALQVRPGTLLRLDPQTLVPTAPPLQLSTGRTQGLAVGLGYVWATAADTGDVLRIDPVTRTIKRTHVGGTPLGIVVAGGSIWYADRERGEVLRLEPHTLRAVGRPIHVGSDPVWIGSADHYLLVGNTDGGTATRIDVRSGTKAGQPIRIARSARDAPDFAVVPAGRSIWVSSFASNTLTRVSATPSAASAPPAVTASSAKGTSTVARALPRAGKVVARIPVPGGGPLAVGEGAVWAMSDADSTLMRIDPQRNAVVARIKVAPEGDAAAGEGAVWLTHPGSDTVSRIDPRTNAVTETIVVGPQPAGISVSPGAVWVANAGGPSVSRIDPVTNRVVATIRVGPHLACCSEHMGVFAGGGAVWAAVPNGNRIVRIDPATNAVTAIVKLPYCPGGYLIADKTALWSAGGGCGDVVARIDSRTNRLTGPLEREPHPVGLGLAFGSVWVAVLDSANVDRIDPQTGRVVARLPVGGIPVRLAVGFGAVWVNDDRGLVLRIEPLS
jgi:YVTN family beta-propeller protein